MLIRPQIAIDEVLKSSGISKDKNNLKEILDSNYLSVEDVISQLSHVINNSSEDTTRLRGIDTALKLHKVLEADVKEIPSITIIIQSGSAGHEVNGIPSILIPRQLQESNV